MGKFNKVLLNDSFNLGVIHIEINSRYQNPQSQSRDSPLNADDSDTSQKSRKHILAHVIILLVVISIIISALLLYKSAIDPNAFITIIALLQKIVNSVCI